jgi:hypothetical protein
LRTGRLGSPNKTTYCRHPDARDERKDLGGRTSPPHRSFWLAELALRMTSPESWGLL